MAEFHSKIKTIEWVDNYSKMVDQTVLPYEFKYVKITTGQGMFDAIKTMIVRGAPAIGVAGAHGVVLYAQELAQKDLSREEFVKQLLEKAAYMATSRPTAVNLMWACAKQKEIIENSKSDIEEIVEELKQVQVKTCPNASSVLLRVFLELSVDAYLERYDLVKNNAITACSSKEDLNGKVCKVLNHMTQLGTMSNDLSKGIRAEINDKNSVLSIESLNAYVHNEFFYPKADNLIIGWDNIESFFIQLWESINKE